MALRTIRNGPIVISDLETRAQVKFPRNDEWNRSLKEGFPKALWDGRFRQWDVPGATAAARLERWAREVRVTDTNEARQRLIDEAVASGRTSRYVKLSRTCARIETPYNEEIVDICRRLGGLWDHRARVWTIDGCNLAAVIGVTAEIDRLGRIAEGSEMGY